MRKFFFFAISFFISLTFTQNFSSAQTKLPKVVTVEKHHVNYEINSDATFAMTIESQQRVHHEAMIEKKEINQIPYNAAFQDITVLAAYTLKTNGRRVNVPAASISNDLAPEAISVPSLSSLKILKIKFPDLKVGDAMYFKIRIVERKSFFDGYFSSALVFPSIQQWDDIQVSVNAPKDYTFQIETSGLEGGKIADEAERARWLWKASIKTPMEYEVGSPSVWDYSPRIFLSNIPNYEIIGSLYWAEAKKKVVITPQIQQLADEITKDISDTKRQTQAIFDWVNKNIRYVSITLERSVIIPNDAPSILKNRYGDCKDYVTILQALLSAKGIESFPVLVKSDESYLWAKVPTLSRFDHVILYVPTLQAFGDATTPNAALGVLAQVLTGKKGLLAGTKTGEIYIPAVDAKDNSINSEVIINIQPDGTIKSSFVNQYKGHMGIQFRNLFADTEKTSEGFVRLFLAILGHDGSGRITKIVNPYKSSEPFELQVELSLPEIIDFSNSDSFAIPTGINFNTLRELESLILQEKRQTVLSCGTFMLKERFRIDLPKGVSASLLPKGVSFENKSGSYRSTYNLDKETLVITRELIITQDTIPTEDYPVFRELIRKSVDDEKSQIKLNLTTAFKDSLPKTNSKTKTQQPLTAEEKLMKAMGSMLEGDYMRLTPKQAEELETKLQQKPDDVETRIKLIKYYDYKKLDIGSTKSAAAKKQWEKSIAAISQHRLWFLQNRPDIEEAVETFFNTKDELYQQHKKIWLTHIETKKDIRVIGNAAKFFSSLEPDLAEKLYLQGLEISPDDYKLSEQLAEFYYNRIFANTRDKATELKYKEKAFVEYEKTLALNKKERTSKRDSDRPYILRKLSELAFEFKKYEKAKEYATELVIEFGRDAEESGFDDAAHDGNIILGRVALVEGNVEKAKEHLLIAARAPAQKEYSYITIDFELAKELLSKGERNTVIEYLQLCEKLREEKIPLFRKWVRLIKLGRTPTFDIYESAK